MSFEYQYSQKVMGVQLNVLLLFYKENKEQSIFLFENTFKEISQYEKIFSRFIKESELETLNTNKELQASDTFIEVLQEAVSLNQKTERTFNPLCSPRFFGYTKDFNSSHHSFTGSFENFSTDIKQIKIKGNNVRIGENQMLDFGGFLKGYITEKIAKELEKNAILKGGIITLGGDMYIFGEDTTRKEWDIEIKSPFGEILPIKTLPKAIVTSSVEKRKWGKFHHIIDSKTSFPAESDLSGVSIFHSSGSLADALATCCIIWGSKKSKQYLENNAIPFLLFFKDGTIEKSHHFEN